MKEFIIAYKEIAWVIAVCLIILLMSTITHKVLKLVERKWLNAAEFSSAFKSLRRISKVFYSLLGMGLISYLFFEESMYKTINTNIGRIIWIGLVATATIVGSALTQGYFRTKVRRLSTRDKGDVTLYKYLNYLVTALVYLFGIILIALAFPALRNFAAAAGASAGAIALVAGVASQEGISNLVGGLFIAFFKPFRIGDVVKIGADIMGVVEDVNLRHTVINNFQNKRIVIPNAIVNKENIINYYLGEYKNCEWIEVGISYASNIDKAMQIMREVCEAHPHCLDNRTEKEKQKDAPIVDVQVIRLGSSSVDLKAWVWAASYLTGFKMRNQLYKSIKEQFDKEGIEIPFPHTSLVFKNAIPNAITN